VPFLSDRLSTMRSQSSSNDWRSSLCSTSFSTIVVMVF
jgi:hypothetical protein